MPQALTQRQISGYVVQKQSEHNDLLQEELDIANACLESIHRELNRHGLTSGEIHKRIRYVLKERKPFVYVEKENG